jgi:hypothetical protein
MAMVNVAPVQVSVSCDPFTGTPRTVRAAGDQFDVLEIERVRDESKAYPMGEGPRTLFVVRTGSARLRLSFGHRDRRWSVVGVDPMADTLAAAA